MTLEEAKEMLKEMKENATHYKKDITIQSVFEALEDTEKAVDIILNYIENESIPKEKVKEVITHLKGCVEIAQGEELLIYDSKIDVLQELLGE